MLRFIGMGMLAALVASGCRTVDLGSSANVGDATRIAGRHRESLIPRAKKARAEGRKLERRKSDASVDRYYEAAVCASAALTAASASTADGEVDETELTRIRDLYNECLGDCLRAAQAMGRLDARAWLLVNAPSGSLTVPIVHRGFVWKPDDFGKLIAPEDVPPNPASHTRHVYPGLGAGVGVERTNPDVSDSDGFLPKTANFNATAVLRPDLEAWLGDPGSRPPTDVLELHDPLRETTVAFAARDWPIAKNLDVANARAHDIQKANGPFSLLGFTLPEQMLDKAKVRMLEPYQPGKIPVLLVHGLLADPFIFNDMIIALQRTPGFLDRHQVWVFGYPTGVTFIRTAAILRKEIGRMTATFDPAGDDPGMQNMVLVGYSMGGLLCRLQVSSSGDEIWRVMANRPLESLKLSEQARSMAKGLFYFEPLPNVRRVIFIATPHDGASWALRGAERMASRLIRRPNDTIRLVAEADRDNPGALRPTIRSLPSSLDALAAQGPLLPAIRRLPVNPRTELHTIAGYGVWPPEHAKGDLVVPLSSAHLDEAVSEHWVRAVHNNIYYQDDTISEVRRILGLSWPVDEPGG